MSDVRIEGTVDDGNEPFVVDMGDIFTHIMIGDMGITCRSLMLDNQDAIKVAESILRAAQEKGL